MWRANFIFLVLFSCSSSLFSQSTVVMGRTVDSYSSDVIPDVEVQIEESKFTAVTNNKGVFNITGTSLPLGEQVLVVTKSGYITQYIRITIKTGQTINLDPILLQLDLTKLQEQIGIISLSENELDQDEGTSYTISGLLQASKDVFLNAAAYDFSATFFRPRGLGNANGKVLINGIEMNKQITGRPQWANWGGLNDAQRNRVFSMGLKANDYSFGDIAGTTNIIMRASKYRRGGRVSYATANRSYRGRVMVSYNSGLSINGWAYSLLASRRYGDKGYIDGTLYEANAFYASVEKKLSESHSINISAFYTPNRRGRSTAITQEVKDIKGITYNPNWGYQNGEVRSSRIRRVEEPVIMLNHFWNISENTHLNTNIGYQFGRIGNTRLDNSGNRNPAGNYYQRLPSYFLRNENPSAYDYQLAYSAQQEFIHDGQLDWQSFYRANASTTNGYSAYSIQEDVNEDTQITLNSILSTRISESVAINGNINYRLLKSQNYAELKDLLGGTGYLDIDSFGDDITQSQSNLQTPNRIVQKGERYKYNYEQDATVFSGFVQAQFKYSAVDFYLAASASQTKYQRTGLYQNGYFPETNRSQGMSEEINFTNYGAKAGFTYKVTGRHLIDLNVGYLTKAPNLRNSFANVRQNNDVVEELTEEKIQSADISYIYRSPIVKARITGYYVGFKDQTDIGFFFTQNALGNDDNNAFVQEIVTGIEKRNAGIEMGIEAQILPTFKLKAAASVGQNTYINNPNLYLAGDDFDDPETIEILEGNDLFSQGKRAVNLKNYRVSGGPERVYQFGFEYRSPEFWWVGVTANYYSNAYIDVSNLRRTSDFYTDIDGQPFNDYDENVARMLLEQEELDDYFLVNIVGGKSWRVRKYYVGFFATINNALNQEYKTGGFENSRRASYRQQVEEQNRANGPLFGNRYFFGNGTTYYLNLYVRF